MAAVAVAFDAGAGGRINTAEAITGYTAEGATPTQEVDFKYQGTFSVSCQVKTSEVGFYYTSSSTDMTTPKVWLAKVIQTNKDAIDGNGLTLRIGSSTSAYHFYNVFSATTYPIAGGWMIVPIDPNVSAHRSGTTGSPSLSAVVYWALRSDASATAKAPNLGIDAIDVITSGTGLTLTGGDGGDADGTFQNFVSFDEGTVDNRYGIVSTRNGILYVVGVLTIGTATATVFTDTVKTLVFPDGRFDTGFCGVDFGLQNASTAITVTQSNFLGRGSKATNDTRPDYTVTGTSGTLSLTSCAFRNFRQMTLTSGATLTDCIFESGENITQASATITNCAITTSTGSVAILANNPGNISNCSFTSDGSSHALEITTAGTYAFSGNNFTNYAGTDGNTGNEVIYNNSGGLVTLNVSGGSGVISVRNGGGASTVVASAATLTIKIVDSDGTAITDTCEVTVVKNSDESVLFNDESVTDGQTEYAYSSGSGTITYINVHNIAGYLNRTVNNHELSSQNETITIQLDEDRFYAT